MTRSPTTTQAARTITDYFETWYCPVKLAMRTERTHHQYRVVIRLFGDFLERPATLDDLQDDVVTAFIGWGRQNRNWSPATCNKARNHLCALWRYAARKRHVDDFPDIDPVPGYRRIPEAWTGEEVQAILRAATLTAGYVGSIPARFFWTALLLTLYDTGARIGAIRQARWRDFQPAKNLLLLRAENQKQRADQAVVLHANTIHLLSLIRGEAGADDLIFPWVQAGTSIWLHFGKILKRAGLPANRRGKFHKMRRTAATNVALLGGTAAASDLLGHSSEHVTKCYIDTTKLPMRSWVDEMPRPETELDLGGLLDLASGSITAIPGGTPRKFVATAAITDASRERPPAPADDTPLVELLLSFSEHLRQCGYERHYTMQAGWDIQNWIRMMELDLLADLRPDSLTAYLAKLTANGLAPNTVKHRRSGIYAFLRWLVEVRGCDGDVLECYANVMVRPHAHRRAMKLDDVGRGGAAQPGTIMHFFVSTIEPQLICEMSPSSVKSYRPYVNAYLRFAGGGATMADLTEERIVEFENAMLGLVEPISASQYGQAMRRILHRSASDGAAKGGGEQ